MSGQNPVKSLGSATTLSPEQRKFQRLINKINAQKALLVQWQEAIAMGRQQFATQLTPLYDRMNQHQLEMVQFLDAQLTQHKFTLIQRSKLQALIVEVCAALLDYRPHEAAQTLYAKHGGGDYAHQTQIMQASMKRYAKKMFEAEFDIVLEEGDLDMNDLRATAERLAAKAKEQADAKAAARPQRKKSAKQLAKEAQEVEAAEHASKSIRAVYRQLTRILHPDREMNPAERERKTELMQQVTVAYERNDFLKLLELQLMVEQINPEKINEIAADRLKHYNRVLTDQLNELEEEIELKSHAIRAILPGSFKDSPSPKDILQFIQAEVMDYKIKIQTIQDDFQRFHDVRQLKAWLKTYRPAPHRELSFL